MKIGAGELVIEINGVKSEIVGINKISEYARGFMMYGFCVQALNPEKNTEQIPGYDLISVTLNSAETGEIGKAEAFVKR